MRDHDRDTKKDGAQGQPPPKAKTGGEQDAARKHADGHAAAHPDILRDGRLGHPANAEPLAELLSQLQHSHGNAYVQRVVNEAGGEQSQEERPAAESHAQGLDAGTRSRMESALGESFGDVRVHTGEHAGEAAEELGARAFTRGRDIYFKEGEYDPATRDGQELLAHELTHVVQQRGGSSAQGASVGRAGDTYEQEADDIAALVVSGERARVERQSAAPAYQRQEAGAKQQPAGAQVVRQFIDAAHVAGGNSEGVEYTFTARGADFIIDFHLPARGSFVSVTPADRARRSSSGASSERLTVTRRPGESLSLEVSIRAGNKTLQLTIRLPRPS
jgi:hypothetical protein